MILIMPAQGIAPNYAKPTASTPLTTNQNKTLFPYIHAAQSINLRGNNFIVSYIQTAVVICRKSEWS